MDDASPEIDNLEIWATLTAFGFMLEHVFAHVLISDGLSTEEVRELRDRQLKAFEEHPWRNDATASESDFVFRQNALHRLERLWVGIEKRVAAASLG